MAAISAVFTIGYVANLLGEEEDWLFDLAIGMEPEDGSLWVYGVGEDGVPAFTRGHRQPAPDRRRRKSGWKRTAAQAAEIAPLRCSPHAYFQNGASPPFGPYPLHAVASSEAGQGHTMIPTSLQPPANERAEADACGQRPDNEPNPKKLHQASVCGD